MAFENIELWWVTGAQLLYGGDAVVSSEGDIRIIDFNDWPSFSACRDDAAKAIAARIHQML